MQKLRRLFADFIFQNSPRISAYVAAAFGYLKSPQKSYSLYGEDLLLLHLFNRNSKGVYVDIGAFHERWISNTHALSKLGWSGVAVDVDTNKLVSFSLRRNCHTRVGAVVPKGFSEQEVVLYKFNRMSSEYDTIDKATADEYAQRYGLNYATVSVPAIAIDHLFESAVKLFSENIRYVNIDVEGADEAILMSINPDAFGIEVVQFENNIDHGGSSLLREHLTNRGYTLVATQGGTHTYVKNEIIKRRFFGSDTKTEYQAGSES